MLRSPEYSLTSVAQFFSAYSHPFPEDAFHRLLAQIISSAKSTNPIVRTNSVALFKVLIERHDSADTHNLSCAAVTELVNLPKTGKSSGPDHRIALYTMLAALVPAPGISLPLVQAITVLVAKEPHDGAAALLAGTLTPHIAHLLRTQEGVLPAETVALIAKDMASSKPIVRHAFIGAAGSVFLNDGGVLDTAGGVTLGQALLGSFEACLKTVAANPLGASGGPYEGYVALAVLLGPFARSKLFGLCFTVYPDAMLIDVGHVDIAIASNGAIAGITAGGTKQSFLLWDKVYQKLTQEDDERWLLRATDAALEYFAHDLAKNEPLRYAVFMLLFIQCLYCFDNIDRNSGSCTCTSHWTASSLRFESLRVRPLLRL